MELTRLFKKTHTGSEYTRATNAALCRQFHEEVLAFFGKDLG